MKDFFRFRSNARADAPESDMNPESPNAAPPAGEPEVPEAVLRLAAELDNLRRRTKRDIDFARRQERKKLLRAVLEVLDNFERALTAAEDNPLREGLEGIRHQMLDMLKRFGVEPIAAQDADFDPERHDAVATAEVPDVPAGKVVEVVQPGYMLDCGDVVRPARVVVSR
ncbi:MAG: nucleotide exchange factor GrpE [Candidatus Sumerlaeia bacterium]|nr:nucleotide exchange factor GrpE [Candidatus Sumerlaeia bacterium]